MRLACDEQKIRDYITPILSHVYEIYFEDSEKFEGVDFEGHAVPKKFWGASSFSHKHQTKFGHWRLPLEMAAVGRGERREVNTGLHESTCASAQLAVQVLYSEVRSRSCQGYTVTVTVTYTMPVSRYTIYVPLLIGRSIPCTD